MAAKQYAFLSLAQFIERARHPLETAHAIAYLETLCPQLIGSFRIVINCSGRCDKDVQTVAKIFSTEFSHEVKQGKVAAQGLSDEVKHKLLKLVAAADNLVTIAARFALTFSNRNRPKLFPVGNQLLGRFLLNIFDAKSCLF